MFFEVVIFLILFLILYTIWNQDPPGYPPGPFRIPIIGGGVPINDERCIKAQKKYGNLILDKIGKVYWLTICDYKLSKEALSKTELANRPQLELLKKFAGGKTKGIASVNGEHWKTNRRFLIHYLKESGMGKSFLEESIKTEAKEIVTEFNRLAGLTTTLTFLNFATLNVIWQIVASKRYDVNDPILDDVQRLNFAFSKAFGPVLLKECMPLLKYLVPRSLSNYFFEEEAFLAFFEELSDITKPVIEEHKNNFDRNNPKDLIDFYSLELENPQQLMAEHVSESDLRSITVDLFNAGSDTISISLRWAILYLAKYPEKQTKMQTEIDNVVPRGILPGYEHKSRLPFCEAVIHETLRKSSLANFGGIRTNTEEFVLGGYTIPKDSIIVSAVSFIHHDPQYWKNPDEFIPERFIDEDGKFFCPKEGFLPFGIGRRQCPGEGLARSELYIYLTAIFQNFSFSALDGETIDDTYSSKSVIFHLPEIQEVRVHKRA